MSLLQRFFDTVLNFPVRSPASSHLFRWLRRAYYAVPKGRFSTIQYSLNGVTLHFNADHRLPLTRKLYPDDSMSVGRVARIVSEKYPDDVFVDIGANVGDTAAIIRSHAVRNRLICVEGVEYFFRLLERNAKSIGAVTPIKAFVSTRSASGDGRVRVLSSGNAVIFDEPALYPESSSADTINLQFHALSDLLNGRMDGAKVKLLKTDIEGFDMPVLNANLDLVSAHRPVIFFEMHVSDVDERTRKIGWKELFSNMQQLGYSSAFYWICSREYLCHVSMSHHDTIEDLNEYFRNRQGLLYADVCLVHSSDGDLAEKIHACELAHARALRSSLP